MIPSKFSMESGGAPPWAASAVYAGGWSLYLDMVKVMCWSLESRVLRVSVTFYVSFVINPNYFL